MYDLEVEGAHEFFANGVLVHNSFESISRFFEARPVGRAISAADVARVQLKAQIAQLDPLSRREQETMRKGEIGPQAAPMLFPRGF